MSSNEVETVGMVADLGGRAETLLDPMTQALDGAVRGKNAPDAGLEVLQEVQPGSSSNFSVTSLATREETVRTMLSQDASPSPLVSQILDCYLILEAFRGSEIPETAFPPEISKPLKPRGLQGLSTVKFIETAHKTFLKILNPKPRAMAQLSVDVLDVNTAFSLITQAVEEKTEQQMLSLKEFSKSAGVSLHLRSAVPADLSEYKDSYFLCNDQLYYVGTVFEKNLDGLTQELPQAQDVPIEDFEKFKRQLAKLNPTQATTLQLLNTEARELITLNGGHSWSGKLKVQKAFSELFTDVEFRFKENLDKIQQEVSFFKDWLPKLDPKTAQAFADLVQELETLQATQTELTERLEVLKAQGLAEAEAEQVQQFLDLYPADFLKRQGEAFAKAFILFKQVEASLVSSADSIVTRDFLSKLELIHSEQAPTADTLAALNMRFAQAYVVCGRQVYFVNQVSQEIIPFDPLNEEQWNAKDYPIKAFSIADWANTQPAEDEIAVAFIKLTPEGHSQLSYKILDAQGKVQEGIATIRDQDLSALKPEDLDLAKANLLTNIAYSGHIVPNFHQISRDVQEPQIIDELSAGLAGKILKVKGKAFEPTKQLIVQKNKANNPYSSSLFQSFNRRMAPSTEIFKSFDPATIAGKIEAIKALWKNFFTSNTQTNVIEALYKDTYIASVASSEMCERLKTPTEKDGLLDFFKGDKAAVLLNFAKHHNPNRAHALKALQALQEIMLKSPVTQSEIKHWVKIYLNDKQALSYLSENELKALKLTLKQPRVKNTEEKVKQLTRVIEAVLPVFNGVWEEAQAGLNDFKRSEDVLALYPEIKKIRENATENNLPISEQLAQLQALKDRQDNSRFLTSVFEAEVQRIHGAVPSKMNLLIETVSEELRESLNSNLATASSKTHFSDNRIENMAVEALILNQLQLQLDQVKELNIFNEEFLNNLDLKSIIDALYEPHKKNFDLQTYTKILHQVPYLLMHKIHAELGQNLAIKKVLSPEMLKAYPEASLSNLKTIAFREWMKMKTANTVMLKAIDRASSAREICELLSRTKDAQNSAQFSGLKQAFEEGLSNPALLRRSLSRRFSKTALLEKSAEGVGFKLPARTMSPKSDLRADIPYPKMVGSVFSTIRQYQNIETTAHTSAAKKAAIQGWSVEYHRKASAHAASENLGEAVPAPADMQLYDSVKVLHHKQHVFTIKPAKIPEAQPHAGAAAAVGITVHRHHTEDIYLAVGMMVSAMAESGKKEICVSMNLQAAGAAEKILDYANIILRLRAIPVLKEGEKVLTPEETLQCLQNIANCNPGNALGTKANGLVAHYEALVSDIKNRQTEDQLFLAKFEQEIQKEEQRPDQIIRKLVSMTFDHHNLSEDRLSDYLIAYARYLQATGGAQALLDYTQITEDAVQVKTRKLVKNWLRRDLGVSSVDDEPLKKEAELVFTQARLQTSVYAHANSAKLLNTSSSLFGGVLRSVKESFNAAAQGLGVVAVVLPPQA